MTLAAVGVGDGSTVQLAGQDAAAGKVRREAREAERARVAEAAELCSLLEGEARQRRCMELQALPVGVLSEPQREVLVAEARRKTIGRVRNVLVLCVVIVVALVIVYFTAGCEGGRECIRPGGECDGFLVASCPADFEIDALMALVGGGSVEWDPSTDPCGEGWDGITCDDDGDRVVKIGIGVASRGEIRGDLASLAPLTQLNLLWLSSTRVSGDVSVLAPLTQLTVFACYHTSVSGDVGSFAPLTQLRYLRLGGTSVSGDVSGLAPLT